MTKRKIILSVAIPTYNVEKYLDRCLTSLLNDEETNKKIELIVINDGSKDGSLNIALKYQKLYPDTVVVVDKENGGHGSGINVGLSKANGKYFRVIDSDDWVNIDDFPAYVSDLEKCEADLVLTNFTKEFIATGTRELQSYPSELEYNKLYDFKNFDNNILKLDYFYMAASTFKTEKLKKANFKIDEKTYYVDMEFIIYPIKEIKTFIYYNYDIYRYFIGRPNQSIAQKNYIRNRKDHEKVMKQLVKYYSEAKLNKSQKIYVKKIVELMLRTHYLIYCIYYGPKAARKEIREFDRFLKDANVELYDCINIGYIKANRQTKFVFISRYRNLFSRITNKMFRMEDVKCED